MTGVIVQTFNKVRNFFAGLSLGNDRDRPQLAVQNQEGQLYGDQPYLGEQQSSRFQFFNSGLEGRRKRPAERLIEIELEVTEDEDESPGENIPRDWTKSYYPNYPNKRFRTHDNLDQGRGTFRREINSNNMTDSNNKRSSYVTRGSGISPEIEGLERQPWEFKFKSKKSSAASAAQNSLQCQLKDSVEWARGNLLKDAPSTSQQAVNASNSIHSQDASHSSNSNSHAGVASEEKTDFSTFRFKQSSKEVDLITLEDDDSNKSNRVQQSQPAAAFIRKADRPAFFVYAGTSHPRQTEERFLKKNFQSQMKAKNFTSMLSCVGKRIDSLSNTIRLEEKQTYANLIKRMESSKLMGIKNQLPLQRSKLNSTDVKAVYRSFANTSPSVTFQGRFDKLFATPNSSSTPKNFPQSSRSSIKLFSGGLSSEQGTPNSMPSPILIDLEKDEQDKDESQKLVNGPPTSASFNGIIPKINPHASFADLTDALSCSLGSETDKQNAASSVEKDNESQSHEDLDDDHQNRNNLGDKDDDDITILSETILQKFGRGRRLNSLALEQSLSPYVQREWLSNHSKSRRDDQEYRDKQIQENLETLDVLHKESTLDRDLRERMRKKLLLTEIIVLEEPIPTLPEITSEMRVVIDLAKRPGRESEVLAQVFNVDITRGDIKTLAPCKWLNDNVINVYMELIARRSKEESSFPTAHVFSTFFYPKLLKEGYSNILKRWTRKADIFANDLIIFPIHLGLHWCLACADCRHKTIKYYDSLGGRNDKCLHSLLNYLANEMKERKGVILNKEEWTLENVEDIPQQQNGSDCGVFSCKFAEYLSRDANLTFQQENMNYYRERMVYELLKQDLMYP